MICPFCASEKTKVINTKKGFITERYRVCESCGAYFKTIEKPQISQVLTPQEKAELKEFLESESEKNTK